MHHQPTTAILLGVVVGGVVRNVAVDHPFPSLEGRPDPVVALPRAHINRVGFEAICGRERLPVAGHHRERSAV